MEWDEGVILAGKLLSTKDSAFMYAERLTELAVALGFDGWLINMEVKLDVGQIPNLIEFVNHLTETMHSSVPESLVIWYDSVTTDGSLLWQDKLNEKNKPFFDVCDGIFVNYTWKESYPMESAAVAGERKYDVYMGIDVFGRNTYGGGQWTVGLYTNYSVHILLLYCLSTVSCKFTTLLRSELNEHKALLTPPRFVQTNAALDVIKKDNVSAAIFAPAWVYETKQPPDFQTAQNRWWGLVEKSWGISQKYPQMLPFYSNFDQGHGYHVFIDGVQILDAPWNNISLQSFQPFLVSGEPTTGTIEVFVDFKEGSYSGGGNITFSGTLDKSAHFRTRLFEGKLLLGESPLNFTYSVKSSMSSRIGLSLLFSSASNEKKSVLLASSGDPLHTYDHLASHFDSVIMPHEVTKHGAKPGWVVQESSIAMDGYTLTEIGATCYKLKTEPTEPEQTTSSSGSSDYHAVLGHIAVTTPESNPILPPANSWLIDSKYVAWSSDSRKLSMMLTWQLKNGNADLSMQYNIHVQKVTKSSNEELNNGVKGAQFLGAAMVEAFYISDLEIPDGTSTLKFIIQVTIDGISQKLEDSPSYQLNVQDS